MHGHCNVSGECKCRHGWRGELCDQCTPYPGCKHGYCNGSSWQCICDTNWGGILCDQDLNYCGTHEPCQNGGTCENTAPDQYKCTCPEGFSGPTCEKVDNPCASNPCANGATCRELGESAHCECAPGFSGPYCGTDIDECASQPCQNGGTCVDGKNEFVCNCPTAWQGILCQFDVDECALKESPCKNSLTCVNLAGDYKWVRFLLYFVWSLYRTWNVDVSSVSSTDNFRIVTNLITHELDTWSNIRIISKFSHFMLES